MTENFTPTPKWKYFLGILSLSAPWMLLIYQLIVFWETNEQYAHGFLVPLLCLFLILKSYPQENKETALQSSSPLEGKLSYIVCIPIVILFLPVWLIRGANSDWRLINVALFSLTLLYTFALLYDDGGWKRIKHLIYPFLFFAVAIPWPLKTDLELTQWLQTKVSSIIVDILLLSEHLASLEGTVIDVGVFGKIGVDQACSGINGLQSSLVVTLFLGAYYGFGWINRIFLVVSGMLLALLLNLCRAFSISWIKVKGKGSLIDDSMFSVWGWSSPSVHDMLGWIETFAIFLAILFLARMAKGGLFLTTLVDEPNRWLNLRCANKPICNFLFVLAFAGIAWGAEVHYQSVESKMIDSPDLILDVGDQDITSENLEISKQIAAQLHFQDAKFLKWQDRFRSRPNQLGEFVIDQNDEYWQGFIARWEKGGACTAVLSTHSPDSCIPLTGLIQISPPPGEPAPILNIDIDGKLISFEAYEFSRHYRKLFVFRCFWPHKIATGQSNLFPQGGYNFSGRIDSAFEGRRNVGGTMLALALANVDSSKTATAKLQALANQRLSFSATENQ